MSDRLKLAREIAARTKPRFIEIPRERGGGKVPFTEEQLNDIRGGLTAEEYRWKLIREFLLRSGRRADARAFYTSFVPLGRDFRSIERSSRSL